MKRPKRQGSPANGISRAVEIAVGIALFLVCLAGIVGVIYMAVKGGVWIWES